jgi:hypothetical protein
MKICLAYPQRLGDIIRILPIARHFAADGNKVLVECLPPYHEFFDCVSYCRPSLRAERDAQRVRGIRQDLAGLRLRLKPDARRH